MDFTACEKENLDEPDHGIMHRVGRPKQGHLKAARDHDFMEIANY